MVSLRALCLDSKLHHERKETTGGIPEHLGSGRAIKPCQQVWVLGAASTVLGGLSSLSTGLDLEFPRRHTCKHGWEDVSGEG